MPRQFANVMVLSLVAIGVAGLMLSTLSAIGAEGVSYAERIGLIALWVAVMASIGRGIHRQAQEAGGDARQPGSEDRDHRRFAHDRHRDAAGNHHRRVPASGAAEVKTVISDW